MFDSTEKSWKFDRYTKFIATCYSGYSEATGWNLQSCCLILRTTRNRLIRIDYRFQSVEGSVLLKSGALSIIIKIKFSC